MTKIPTIFRRSDAGLITCEIHPECLWVFREEGVPTRKWDGTACLSKDGQLWKRYTHKRGKTAPPDFMPSSGINPDTGKQEGWVPVGDGPEDKWHRAAVARGTDYEGNYLDNHTYELCGPKVQGNPEKMGKHYLVRHGLHVLANVPHAYDALCEYFRAHDIEGIVWHHPDGRMAKIKGRDFGIKRPSASEQIDNSENGG